MGVRIHLAQVFGKLDEFKARVTFPTHYDSAAYGEKNRRVVVDNQGEGGLLKFLDTHPVAHPITYNHRMVTAQIVNQKPSVLILAFAKKLAYSSDVLMLVCFSKRNTCNA